MGFENLKAGEIIRFGRYPQSGDPSAGADPIEWIVLETNGETALLISRYGLVSKTFDELDGVVTWDICTLRAWLNSDFLNEAFSGEEQACLETADVPVDYNPHTWVDPGKDTRDKVFLLSVEEAERYFASDEERICFPTKKAIADDAWVRTKPGIGRGACQWWLRTPGSLASFAAIVDADGGFDLDGICVNISGLRGQTVVRPAVVLRFSRGDPRSEI